MSNEAAGELVLRGKQIQTALNALETVGRNARAQQRLTRLLEAHRMFGDGEEQVVTTEKGATADTERADIMAGCMALWNCIKTRSAATDLYFDLEQKPRPEVFIPSQGRPVEDLPVFAEAETIQQPVDPVKIAA